MGRNLGDADKGMAEMVEHVLLSREYGAKVFLLMLDWGVKDDENEEIAKDLPDILAQQFVKGLADGRAVVAAAEVD